jgi:arginase family enzyme
VEGPLIVVPDSFTGSDGVGPNARALARLIGEGEEVVAVAPALPAERLVYFGLRDVDPGEQELLDRPGATVAAEPAEALRALGDGPVFVHLDPDVIDGHPSAFPSPPGGPTADDLRALLAEVARRNEVVGVTVACVAGPPEIPHRIVESLL